MMAALSPTLNTVSDVLADVRLDPLERRLLLCAAAGLSREDVARAPETRLAPLAIERYEQLTARRLLGEPIAYLLGYREFYGRNFLTDAHVLIPRPESELLVELALSHVDPQAARTRVLDIGTGSGCLAITLKLEQPVCEVIAIDVSLEALTVARRNAARLGAEVIWIHSDLSDTYPGKFNIIMANPPYIASGDVHLGQGDLRFEPALALVGGPTGTELIESLVHSASRSLAPGGWLLIEHGYDQAATVRGFLQRAGLVAVTTWTDLAAMDRVTGAQFAGSEAVSAIPPQMD